MPLPDDYPLPRVGTLHVPRAAASVPRAAVEVAAPRGPWRDLAVRLTSPRLPRAVFALPRPLRKQEH
ncbi:hypothetical protein [Actinocorallia libanotica]|uniref:Uncharacterized protein n=1 Tax=Actinocorallia libanotica TaxID=46162 RepID=A0ABN1RK43_9ACTN